MTAGDRLGPYEILSLIGAGGMGEVWKARDTRLDRLVAIKLLDANHSARFEQEARAIAALNHVNICQIHDVGPDCLVMEFVDGKPLAGPLPAEDAVKLGIQIAAALEEAHSKRILHRDLKPANILVNSKGTVKLLDFGLAKLMNDASPEITRTMDGAVMGTAAYMSPEQAEGRALDERSDIFSFGAVLYELLSGERAFAGNTMAQVLSAVLHSDPKPIEAPAALDRIVRRCLAKSPRDRFQTAAELRAALLEYTSRPAEHKPSIAVLPFVNMSGDKDNEYFSDGLAEEILNLLVRVQGLKVIARTSSFAFRGKDQDIRRIADLLGVRTILEGSVRRAGNRIRVAAQLINAEDGAHLWSERYDRELTDIFALQDEIAAAIADALKLKFAAKARHTPNLAAHEAYLKGQSCLYVQSPDALSAARERYERSIALDPEYAQPHSGLGAYYYSLSLNALRPSHETVPLARAALERALAIDAYSSDAHARLATLIRSYDYDWSGAEHHLKIAQNSPEPTFLLHLHAANYYYCLGRHRECLMESERMIEQDPFDAYKRAQLSLHLNAAGEVERALRESLRAQEINGNHWMAHASEIWPRLVRGEEAQALDAAERAVEVAPWKTLLFGTLAALMVRSGQRSRAEEILDGMRQWLPHQPPLPMALYCELCGDVDAAAEWFAKAVEFRDLSLVSVVPHFRLLRASDHWRRLAGLINLPKAARSA